MSEYRVEFREVDGETREMVLVTGGQEFEIASVNHDEHGWSGMAAVENAVKSFADIMGVEVREV